MRRTIEKIKGRKGITLIALVVTIVVILILAGITVGMVTIDNGILKETKNAKQQAEIDNEKSIVERAKMLAMMRSKNGAITYEIFEPALKEEAGTNPTEVSDVENVIEVLFTDSNRYYEVDKDGNVSNPQEVVKDEYAGDITKGGRCDGSEEKPYEISCIEDLVVFSNMTNGTGIKLENGQAVTITKADSFQNKNVILTRNLNFKSKYSYANSERTDFGNLNNDNTDGNSLMIEMTTGTGFVPIGGFEGNFNGNNRSLFNILINRENVSEATGLFAKVGNGNIIENLMITGDIKSNGHTGGIVGNDFGNTGITIIRNCVNKASVTGYNSVGGIIGYADVRNTSRHIIIENCENYGNIKSTDGYWSYTGTGGIAGGSSIDTIINCRNYGKITGKHRLGGIAGYIGYQNGYSGSIQNCYNVGEINTENEEAQAGGIIAQTGGGNLTIKNCINAGNVQGASTKGGIISKTDSGGYNAEINFSIENSINFGNVISNNGTAGGIVGAQGNISKNCYITLRNVASLGKVEGKTVGGVIAYIRITENSDVKTILENVYYTVPPIVKIGSLTSGEATLKTEKEIKSQAFVDLLNSNIGTNTDWKKWKLGSDGYPTFVE